MARPTDKKVLMRPPEGVPVQPPDQVDPTSTLSYSTPTMSTVSGKGQEILDSLVGEVDERHLEQRITLLSRLIIESALWTVEGWTKKERVDAALRAISTFEGSKSKLWVEPEDGKPLPKTEEEFLKEKKALEGRLLALVKKEKLLPKLVDKAKNDAFKLAEAQNTVVSGEGEA